MPLSLDEHLGAVADPAFGAVVNFIGRIRNHDPGAASEVESIEYSCHPDADRIISEIASRVATPGTRLAVSHRIGRVPVGGLALVACVAAAHREEAYSVSRELVEAIKLELPIWKRQIEVDGAGTWVGIR
ncbi:MAG: molybdenum cofactor biosynthesis protein MoaE [Solirubrobacterales bacterium]|nr:molybdenum cofactor biosynthesis protein MoaE [Solirubrobacterales bacterium]